MTRKTKLALAASGIAIIGLSAVAATAVANDHHKRHGGHKHAVVMLEQFDQNQDGTVSITEIETVRTERFNEYDADGDGTLSLEEYEALWLEAMRERMVDQFQEHDDDGNAILTLDEFNERWSQMAERMDRNDDGQITKDEMRKKGKRHHHDDDDDRENG